MRLDIADRAANLAARSRSFRWFLFILASASPVAFPSPARECIEAAFWLGVALWALVMLRDIRDELRKRRARRAAS